MKKLTSILLLFLTFLFASVGNAAAQQKHEYVDLDLPSGTLWATCNIGASNPWDQGDYFAWGEVMPKKDGSWRTYKYSKDDTDKLTKYCIDANYGYNRFTDGRRTLEPSDDAATVNWGNEWCMPTKEEFTELINNCSIEYVRDYMGHDCDGIVVRSKKNSRKYIFLCDDLIETSYWTSTISPIHDEKAGEYIYDFLDDGSLNVDREVITVGTDAECLCLSVWSGELSVKIEGVPRYIPCPIRAVRKNKSTSQHQTPPSNSSQTNTPSSSTTHKYIDLGLPSRTLWATTNIGAANPWDYGDYFAWGETTTKSKYDWSTLKYCEDNTGDKFSKYNTQSKYGSVDNKTTLERSDDAATANWGSDWCMPTLDQIKELKEKCKWVWTTDHGVNGYKVTGPNGNSLFLPAAGYRYGTDLGYVGSGGTYWSRSLDESYPYYAGALWFRSSYVGWRYYGRDLGLTVRPVRCR